MPRSTSVPNTQALTPEKLTTSQGFAKTAATTPEGTTHIPVVARTAVGPVNPAAMKANPPVVDQAAQQADSAGDAVRQSDSWFRRVVSKIVPSALSPLFFI